MDWFKQGTDFPELDQATFAPRPVEPGEPVQPSFRWGLIKVVDIRAILVAGLREEERKKFMPQKQLLLCGKMSGWRKTVCVINET